jgi:hypothetical protein
VVETTVSLNPTGVEAAAGEARPSDTSTAKNRATKVTGVRRRRIAPARVEPLM